MTRFLLALLCCCAFRAAGAEPAPLWPPIPPEVWALKDATLPGGMGAINVSRRLQAINSHVAHQYRIRICSERGKGAAEFSTFPTSTSNLRGRVVYPDGKEVAFQSDRDFHTKIVSTTAKGENQRKLLVPPGLTDDCVVDLRWEEPRYWELWSRYGKGDEVFDLATPYPIQTLSVELGAMNYFSYSLMSTPQDRTKTVVGDLVVHTMKNVPAMAPVPFSIRSDLDVPRLKLFVLNTRLGDAARKGSGPFWDEVVLLYKEFFTKGVTAGKPYQTLSAALRKDLPPGPQASAAELMLRLRERIRNLDQLTLQEQAARTRKAVDKRLDTRDLDAAAERGDTTSMGMLLLGFRMLQDAGLRPRLTIVTNRDKATFNLQLKDPSLLDDILLMVEEPGQPAIWLDPSRRFGPPTLIHPLYQGTLALEMDPAAWTRRVIRMPSQAPATNQRRDTYRLELLPGQDRVTLDATFLGYEDLYRRAGYAALEPREQNLQLKEALENLGNAQVDRAEVLQGTDLRKPLSWHVEARLERAQGRHRRVDPFPLTPSALDVPEQLAATRKEPIVLPYRLERRTESRFLLPPGYAWSGKGSYSRSNAFGSVTLKVEQTATPQGPELTAILEVRTEVADAGATQWPAFKDYLGWLREAANTSILLEKIP